MTRPFNDSCLKAILERRVLVMNQTTVRDHNYQGRSLWMNPAIFIIMKTESQLRFPMFNSIDLEGAI
jgi:hypothetical protein